MLQDAIVPNQQITLPPLVPIDDAFVAKITKHLVDQLLRLGHWQLVDTNGRQAVYPDPDGIHPRFAIQNRMIGTR
tara:strand:- start:2119 stop:2343 length:225 start_codon:yes stop_codon:yes gene_type:complete